MAYDESLTQQAFSGPGDHEVIDAVCGGDTEAFEVLVSRYGNRVYALCYRLSGNEADAADLAQTVFARAFRSLKSFKRDAALMTWLHTIAVNTWINIANRRKKVYFDSIDREFDTGEDTIVREYADPTQNVEESVARAGEAVLVQAQLMKLDPDQRLAVVLRYIEGRSYEEIAALCACSIGTVGSRLSRALEKLKDGLEPLLGAKKGRL